MAAAAMRLGPQQVRADATTGRAGGQSEAHDVEMQLGLDDEELLVGSDGDVDMRAGVGPARPMQVRRGRVRPQHVGEAAERRGAEQHARGQADSAVGLGRDETHDAEMQLGLDDGKLPGGERGGAGLRAAGAARHAWRKSLSRSEAGAARKKARTDRRAANFGAESTAQHTGATDV